MAKLESHTLEAFMNFMNNITDITSMTVGKAESFFTHLGVTGNTEVRYRNVQVSAVPEGKGDDYNVLVLDAGKHTITLVYNRKPGFIRVAIDNRIYKSFIDRGLYWEFIPAKQFIGQFFVWNDRKTGRLCTQIE